MRQGEVPPADELRRLYVVDDLPMAALMERYGVGQKRVRGWLADAAIPIRTKHDAGRRRQLEPPSPEELRSLYVTRRLPAHEIASQLGVSTQTVFKWMAEAGIEARRAPLKGRPRGRREMAERPDESTLRRLYETEGSR